MVIVRLLYERLSLSPWIALTQYIKASYRSELNKQTYTREARQQHTAERNKTKPSRPSYYYLAFITSHHQPSQAHISLNSFLAHCICRHSAVKASTPTTLLTPTTTITMEWPHFDGETFAFVTTPTAKQIWRRAIEAGLGDITVDHNTKTPGLKGKVQQWTARLAACENNNWRTEYRTLLADFTALMASMDNDQALDVAQAGLDAVHDLMLYRIDANTVVPAKDVFVLTNSFPKLGTCTLVGTKAPDIDFQFGLANPQNPTNDTLYGMDAVAQVDAWYRYGVMETSASVLAKTTFTSGNISGIVSKKKFVLLGCTSELGPVRSLVQIPGATVLGVARGGKKLDDLIDFVRYNAPDDTTFLYPKSPDEWDGSKGLYPNGGADLLLQGPQIAQWILDQTDKDEDELVIVPLAYMDGEAHVRVAAAMDLIVQRIMRQRSSENTILWSYTSPATCMVLPPMAATRAQQRLQERPVWEKWTNTLSMGRWMAPSNGVVVTGADEDETVPTAVSNNDYTIVNGIVSAQGPNYVLAKTIQQWRCMIAHFRDGQNVSAPFAPATRTSSMTSHGTVSAALEGMHFFEPMLAFDVGPASTLMAAIMVSHLQLMNRPLPDMDESPFTIFWDGAVHGGVWTCPYTLESLSVINYALGKAYYPKGYIPPDALPPPKGEVNENGEELDEDGTVKPKRMVDPDVLLTLTDSQYGKPMPESVKERLEFM